MNSNLPDNDASIHYNDSDYPSKDHGRFPENFDSITQFQGIARDIDRYLEILAGYEGPVLEVGCGSGRVGIPLARAGFDVCGVDVSAGMLELYREKLKREPEELVRRITLIKTDATGLDLGRTDFATALLAFNTLSCINSASDQQLTLSAIANHLRDDGLLVIDLVNPFQLPLNGDQTPKPFFTRRNVWTGRQYTRFAAIGPMDADQRQELFGWYDEIRDDGLVERKRYSIFWRPLFLSEVRLMLEKAGFEIVSVEGGHCGEEFNRTAPKMFIQARKIF